jgi:hypothetical protein
MGFIRMRFRFCVFVLRTPRYGGPARVSRLEIESARLLSRRRSRKWRIPTLFLDAQQGRTTPISGGLSGILCQRREGYRYLRRKGQSHFCRPCRPMPTNASRRCPIGAGTVPAKIGTVPQWGLLPKPGIRRRCEPSSLERVPTVQPGTDFFGWGGRWGKPKTSCFAGVSSANRSIIMDSMIDCRVPATGQGTTISGRLCSGHRS